MKNFDLDKIKDRQLYKMPDAFFEKMQQNVLEKTVLQKETEIIPIRKTYPELKKWIFAAAACIVLFIGSVFFFQNTEENVPSNIAKTEVKAEGSTEIAKPSNDVVTTQTLIADVQENQASTGNNKETIAIKKENVEPKVSFAKNEINKNTSVKSKKTAKSKASIKQAKPEDQIDLLLQNFSAEELAMIAQNSEKDVYLDVYY
jgi:hypothetical protein